MSPAGARPGTRAVLLLARAGYIGRALAVRADAARSTGGGIRRGAPADDAAREAQLAANHSRAYLEIWEQAAVALGADLRELGDGFIAIERDGVRTVTWRHLVMLDHPATVRLALDKLLVHRMLLAEGIPVPDHIEVGPGQTDQALAFAAAADGACVIKPAAGTSGGSGVTCGVRTTDDLLRSWLQASQWDARILVERAVEGREFRLLFLDGKLVDAVERRRPRLTGNGRSSVRELIRSENDRRLSAATGDVSRFLSVDLDCEIAVRESGSSLGSTPPEGQIVVVKGTVGQNAAADNSTAPELSPELIREAARAVELLQLTLAGVDLVTPDPSVSLASAGGAVLEVNATPGLHYHYQLADRTRATPVAVTVLRRLLEGAPGLR